MKKTTPGGVLMLLFTAFIWGSAFVAQSVGIGRIGPCTFHCVRNILGTLVLTPFVLVRIRRLGRGMLLRTIRCGIPVAVVFTAATLSQQYAFLWSSSGRIAFITALYMFFVPILGLPFGRRVPRAMWLCVIAAAFGLWLLCDPRGAGGVGPGEWFSLACAILFAAHILCVDHAVTEADPVMLSWFQFAVCAFFSGIGMLFTEQPSLPDLRAAALPILYAGVLSSGVAYTLQIVGQKHTEPAVASLLMCLESAFAVLCAAIVLKEVPDAREWAGCAVMFAAIIAANLIPQNYRPAEDAEKEQE